MISLQTNVTSLVAQNNLNTDNQLQSKTIQQLTSGYRINSSGDDAAGLAIANGYRSSVAELSQGLQNATNATSQLQIVDGGLSNISTVLDRLKTLATESASSTFTGDRDTLDQEYSGLLSEIDRQAGNINLNAGGSLNSLLNVFVGGGSSANSAVSVNLSGATNAVDAASLGLANTNILDDGAGLTINTQRLDAPGATFLSGSSTGSEDFTFNIATVSGAQTVTATVNGTVAGITKDDALAQLNGQLNQYGITAGLNNNGILQFTGTTAFNMADAVAPTGSLLSSSLVTCGGQFGINGPNFAGFTGAAAGDSESLTIQAGGHTTSITLNAANASSAVAAANTLWNILPYGEPTVISAFNQFLSTWCPTSYSITANNSTPANGFFRQGTTTSPCLAPNTIPANTSNYVAYGLALPASPVAENLSIQAGGQSINIALTAADQASPSSLTTAINAQTAKYGVFALTNALGTGVDLQSADSFSVYSDVAGAFAANNTTVNPPTTSITNNATAAITAIDNATQALGLVQGSVGASQNRLAYASSLVQSQISSYSDAESQIRDADVAAQAANLTKAQVLTQTSVAALAQANSAPQAILKLLQ